MDRAVAVCREYKKYVHANEQATFAQLRDRKETELSRLRAVIDSVTEPRVRVLASDLATEDGLFVALSNSAALRYSRAEAQHLRELNARVRADEQALALGPCVGPLPNKPIAP